MIKPVKFRWPCKQVAPNAVELNIPTSGDTPLVEVNQRAAEMLVLSRKEIELANDAAFNAVVEALMIIS